MGAVLMLPAGAMLSKMQRTVRHPIFSGTQAIGGLWFPVLHSEEARLRQQILSVWRRGADLHRFPSGFLLRFADERPARCEDLPGWPLCRQGRALISAPLTKQESAALPPADVYLVVGARVHDLRIVDAEPMDPSAWIDLSSIVLRDTLDLADTLARPEGKPQPKRALREVLGGAVPPPSEEQSKFLAQLSARQKTAETAQRSQGAFGGASLRGLLAPLLRGFKNSSVAGRSSTVQPRRRDNVAPQPWRGWLSRFLLVTQMSRMLGWRQAGYMKNMLNLFERGDLSEALRHAIPLGDDKGSLGQSFGTPGPRHDLSLSTGLGPSASIGLGAALDNHLRTLYRKAFERLDQAGRVDEAVFVLAELLQSRQEALDYLVKHDRAAQAAELALSWDVSAETIVRLLCLSGDWDRAMQVARRDNAFASAVLMLEKQRPDLGRRLRLEWGEALAARGDWLEAVEAVWPVKPARVKAAEWLRLAEEAGGGLGARALVQRALLLPDTLERYAERIARLRDAFEESSARQELAAALLAVNGSSTGAAKLSGAILPMLLADRVANRNALSKKEFTRLIKLSADSFLQSDLPTLSLPALPVAVPLEQAPAPLHWEAPPAGLQPIGDAVCLSDGQFAVAQGEAGIAVVDSQGRERQRYPVASDRLVIADNGRIVLGLAQRDTVWRVSRVDLVAHRINDLGVLALEHFATTFDGIGWTVVSGGRLFVLDTTRSLRDVLWHVSDLPGEVRTLGRTQHYENLLIDTPSGLELWRYRLPGRRLIQRTGVQEPDSGDSVMLIRPDAEPLHVSVITHERDSGETSLELTCRPGSRVFTVTLPQQPGAGVLQSLRYDNGWLIVGIGYLDTFEWFLINVSRSALKGRVSWPQHHEPKIHVSNGSLLFFDQAGRMLKLTTETAEAHAVVLR